tara:strand:+ start:46840 stop:47253 length:414 start_codon:yes stop_codon:yes gene_type:complete
MLSFTETSAYNSEKIIVGDECIKVTINSVYSDNVVIYNHSKFVFDVYLFESKQNCEITNTSGDNLVVIKQAPNIYRFRYRKNLTNFNVNFERKTDILKPPQLTFNLASNVILKNYGNTLQYKIRGKPITLDTKLNLT